MCIFTFIYVYVDLFQGLRKLGNASTVPLSFLILYKIIYIFVREETVLLLQSRLAGIFGIII